MTQDRLTQRLRAIRSPRTRQALIAQLPTRETLRAPATAVPEFDQTSIQLPLPKSRSANSANLFCFLAVGVFMVAVIAVSAASVFEFVASNTSQPDDVKLSDESVEVFEQPARFTPMPGAPRLLKPPEFVAQIPLIQNPPVANKSAEQSLAKTDPDPTSPAKRLPKTKEHVKSESNQRVTEPRRLRGESISKTFVPIRPVDRVKRLAFRFHAAPWDYVLSHFANHLGMRLKSGKMPRGTFTYQERKLYSPNEAFQILNTHLKPAGYRLEQQGRMLVLVNEPDSHENDRTGIAERVRTSKERTARR